jgi:hypothetical protein
VEINLKIRYYYIVLGGSNMSKFTFIPIIFIIIFMWSCDSATSESTTPSCSASNPCQEGYKCDNGKCIADNPIHACNPGETKPCYTGGSTTRNIGACKDGVITCKEDGNWEPICRNEIKPIQEICGDNIDNDCDGQTDEDCGCNPPGKTRECYTGPQGTENQGICKKGVETCTNEHKWSGECVGEVLPKENICSNIDNDCNGQIDSQEDICNQPTECTPGERRPCSTNGNNIGVGICKAGYNLCNAEGNWGNECIDEVFAQNEETCGDGIDNNCNGQIDEGCECTPQEEKPCYTGNPDELGKGNCESGIMICGDDGKWSQCQGEEKPQEEVCDGVDNDCNGIVDDGVANACGTCGELPVEICDGIDNDCDGIIDNVLPENGGNACGTCGDVPSEICGNGLDDNCDGIIDNPEICNTEPQCEKTSDTEICGNGLDDDCNGIIDDTDKCGNCSGSEECFTGNPNSVIGGNSICKKGISNCIAGETWGACEGEVLPQTEICNGLDDDCDGVVDNGFNVGSPCSVGVGECKRNGIYACNNQGGITCVDSQGAPLVAGTPQEEKGVRGKRPRYFFWRNPEA